MERRDLGHRPLDQACYGEQVGRDDAGNIYYQAKKNPASRWVIYDGSNDGSRVPPDWQAWLKGTIDELPDKALPPRRKFEQPAEVNLTGTMAAFRPDGSLSSKADQAGLDGRLPGLDARLSVRTLALMGAAAGLLLAAAAGGSRIRASRRTARTEPRSNTRPGRSSAGVTPMADRVAVLGFLNKRNGIVRDIRLKPGQSVRMKDAIVRLRACETTAPWENEKLTGAFVQLDVQRPDSSWGRVFSGWVYKESPSLNVVEHPVYDVWPKSCAMTYPSAAGEPAAPVASSNRSSASRSGADERDGLRSQRDRRRSRRLRQRRRPGARSRSAAERARKQRHIGLSRLTLYRAKRGEVGRHELAVEQSVAADLQAGDEPGQRNLRRVGHSAEHAFAEKSPAELHPVKPADQLAAVPDFDGMGVAGRMQGEHRAFDFGVDPGLLAVRAGANHRRKVTVHRNREIAGPDRTPQRPGQMETCRAG